MQGQPLLPEPHPHGPYTCLTRLQPQTGHLPLAGWMDRPTRGLSPSTGGSHSTREADGCPCPCPVTHGPHNRACPAERPPGSWGPKEIKPNTDYVRTLLPSPKHHVDNSKRRLQRQALPPEHTPWAGQRPGGPQGGQEVCMEASPGKGPQTHA